MLYTKETRKSVDHAVHDIEAAAQRHGFGVLHQYDLKATLETKGFPIENECRVLEVCSPLAASRVLKADMSVNMALPCRISVWQDRGQTLVGMIRPTALLGIFPNAEALAGVAEEVDAATRAIIDEAV